MIENIDQCVVPVVEPASLAVAQLLSATSTWSRIFFAHHLRILDGADCQHFAGRLARPP
jgi:hypothetical protein